MTFKALITGINLFISLCIIGSTVSASHKIIIQVSPPRCLSTASLRMWQSRGDFTVMNEPFIAAWVSQNVSDKVLTSSWWRSDAPLSYLEVEQKIVDLAKNGPVFVKEESFVIFDFLKQNPEFLYNPDVHFIFLIRNPHHAIISFYKGNQKIIERFSYLVGYQPCYETLNMVLQASTNTPIILCAEDLYNYPYVTAQELCKKLEISFTENMLQWQDLGASFTGVNEWHELKNPDLTHHWHGAAINSSGFHQPTLYDVDKDNNPTFSEIANEEDRQACISAYYTNKLYYDLLLKEKYKL